jgi:hypothetical protein
MTEKQMLTQVLNLNETQLEELFASELKFDISKEAIEKINTHSCEPEKGKISLSNYQEKLRRTNNEWDGDKFKKANLWREDIVTTIWTSEDGWKETEKKPLIFEKVTQAMVGRNYYAIKIDEDENRNIR